MGQLKTCFPLACLHDVRDERWVVSLFAVCLQDGLALCGWRDRGSCFELCVSSTLAPDAVTCLYEAEVLLLAPGAWSTQSLALFGLNVEELQVCKKSIGFFGVKRACMQIVF